MGRITETQFDKEDRCLVQNTKIDDDEFLLEFTRIFGTENPKKSEDLAMRWVCYKSSEHPVFPHRNEFFPKTVRFIVDKIGIEKYVRSSRRERFGQVYIGTLDVVLHQSAYSYRHYVNRQLEADKLIAKLCMEHLNLVTSKIKGEFKKNELISSIYVLCHEEFLIPLSNLIRRLKGTIPVDIRFKLRELGVSVNSSNKDKNRNVAEECKNIHTLMSVMER